MPTQLRMMTEASQRPCEASHSCIGSPRHARIAWALTLAAAAAVPGVSALGTLSSGSLITLVRPLGRAALYAVDSLAGLGQRAGLHAATSATACAVRTLSPFRVHDIVIIAFIAPDRLLLRVPSAEAGHVKDHATMWMYTTTCMHHPTITSPDHTTTSSSTSAVKILTSMG
jgi:hypothetical protein